MTDLEYAMWLLDMAIPNGECLECHFADGGRGYRKLRWKQYSNAHRFVFAILRKPIGTGLYVLHECDNRACIHPNHLFEGTHQDNVDDMIAKGRHKAEKPGLFTVAQQLEMYLLLSQGVSYGKLAAKYMVAKPTIYKYAKGYRGIYAHTS